MTFYERRLRHLLRLFADNKASEQEITEMLTLLRQKEGDTELDSFVRQLRQEPDTDSARLQVDWESIWDTIHQSAIQPLTPVTMTPVTMTPVRKMKWLHVAAAIVIFISISVYVFNQITLNRKSNEKIVKTGPAQKVTNDILPGGDKAILTLANGSQIILDSAGIGMVAQQGQTAVMKLANGQLVYKGASDPANEVLYNTMETPRGGQYKLILPDGSRVWLNAVSSIRFPTAFTGKERTVEITGEAYFEIEKDVSRPFKVVVRPVSGNGEMELSVLGTHFNVNAYQDEPTIKTTLLEGSVRVSNGTSHTIIKPGQQTQLNNSGVIKVVQDADVEEAVAWKDGRFEFNDTELKTIMRQVMRWYDVDVEYQGNKADRYFTADISRSKTLSGVLTILKLSDVDFKLEGNKLTVTP